jgi:tetratricopeptide (TPR) repeat protein
MSHLTDESVTVQHPVATVPAAGADFVRLMTTIARRSILAILATMLLTGVWFGYRWWVNHRTEQFRSACTAARDQKEWGRLEVASGLWLDWDHQSDDARVFRAEAMLQAGQLEEAQSLLGSVSADYHGCLQAWAFQAEILFTDLNRPLDAEPVWLRMLAKDERADVARRQLVYLYSMTLQFDKLTALLRDGIRIGREPPESYAYLILSRALNFTDGMVVLEKWRRAAPGDETLEVAEAYFFAKNRTSGDGGLFEKSDVVPGDLRPMNDCLKKYPHNLNVLAFHLEKRSFDGDVAGTEEILRMAPPEAEADGRFWKFRSWLLRMNGDPAGAETAARRAIELDIYDWRARWELAAALRLRGKIKEAEEVSLLASEGKAIEKSLMELANAQVLTWGHAERLYRYAMALADDVVVAGLRRRIPDELTNSHVKSSGLEPPGSRRQQQ